MINGAYTPSVEEEDQAIAAFLYLVTSKFMKIRVYAMSLQLHLDHPRPQLVSSCCLIRLERAMKETGNRG
jgi:hypothetical protein